MKKRRTRVLVLWNQTEVDIYEEFKKRGPQPLPWNPDETASEVGTVKEEMDAFVDALRQGGFEVTLVNLRDNLDKITAAVTLHEPDVIFNLVEYFYDDETLEPHIAALYELLDVPYTGNIPSVLAACQRKATTKIMLDDAGLPTAPYVVVEPGKPIPRAEEQELEYPLIVKPAREDASGGIELSSVVENHEALVARCEYVHREFEQSALVEEYIDGREIHCAILGNFVPEVPADEASGSPARPAQTPEALPLFEMEFDDTEFNPDEEWRPQIISYSAKWDPHSRAFYSMDSVCPAEDLEPEVEERIRDVALRAYKVMGCRDYARIDMRVDDDGQPFILEVNPNPDLADGSAYIMCAQASGRTYAQVLGEIVRMALARRPAKEVPAAAVGRAESTDHLTRKYLARPPIVCPHCGGSVPYPEEAAEGDGPARTAAESRSGSTASAGGGAYGHGAAKGGDRAGGEDEGASPDRD